MANQTVWQPIYPALRPFLDPEYVAYHDQVLQYLIPDELKIWDGTAQLQPSPPSGGSVPVRVGKRQDIQLESCKLRVFVPERDIGEPKYPALLWFHAGESRHLV